MIYSIKRFSQEIDEERRAVYNHNMGVFDKMSKEMEDYDRKNPMREDDREKVEKWNQEVENNIRSQKTTFLDRLRGIRSSLSNIGHSINSLGGPSRMVTPDGRVVHKSLLSKAGTMMSGLSATGDHYRAKLDELKYNRAIKKIGEPKLSGYERWRTRDLENIQKKWYRQMKEYPD